MMVVSFSQHISQLQLTSMNCPREQYFQFTGAGLLLIIADTSAPAGQDSKNNINGWDGVFPCLWNFTSWTKSSLQGSQHSHLLSTHNSLLSSVHSTSSRSSFQSPPTIFSKTRTCLPQQYFIGTNFFLI